MEPIDILIKNANELLTIQGINKPRKKKEMNQLGIISNGCIAIKDGKIFDIGKNLSYEANIVVDAQGKIILPGFVDPHTHLVFASSREFELDWKLSGLNYMEIKRKGGGISYTVKKTRQASIHGLYQQSLLRLNTMLKHGTTTCEAKSGYGLDTDTEMKILDVNKKLNEHHHVDIVSTFLGAHSIPENQNVNDYIDIIIDEMLPEIKQRAMFCDVFCEKGFFSYDQSKKILEAGKRYNLIPKIHADELSDVNGGILAAEVNAISADHLLRINPRSMKMMAERNIIGVMLPATPFCLMSKEYAPARKLLDMGVPLALATDLNPNCYVENMQLVIQLACFNMLMTPAEAITAATYNAACALNKQDQIGSLEKGKQADLLILNVKSHQMIPYHVGINHVETIIKRGEILSFV